MQLCHRLLTFYLLLPRLGLWSRDKAAKGKAEVATEVIGRSDVTAIEAEVVGMVSARADPRRPIITFPASADELSSIVRIDTAAPHKEQWTKRDIIRITINWTSASKRSIVICTS